MPRATTSQGQALSAARGYLERQPLPIPYGQKAPRQPDWQNLEITPDKLEDYFGIGRHNVGVRLGLASGGLTDIDLDCSEALTLADTFLPKTGTVFGRASKPRAHRLYITDLGNTERSATIRYEEPASLGGATLVELTIGAGDKGAQTVFPPSRTKR